MKPAALALTLAAVAIGAALLAQRAADSAALDSAQTDTGDGETAIDYLNPIGAAERAIESYSVSSDMKDSNTAAFLAMIAASEGTALKGDPYRVCYGYSHTIQDMSDHPAVTGEWKGLPLSDSLCIGAGMKPGCVSTAAGRYQMTKPTWLMAKRALGLPDFSPASQDAAAVYLIRKRGAIDDVQAGRVADAIDKCRAEWASLPGAGYGQPERRMSTLVAAFRDAGGVLA